MDQQPKLFAVPEPLLARTLKALQDLEHVPAGWTVGQMADLLIQLSQCSANEVRAAEPSGPTAVPKAKADDPSG